MTVIVRALLLMVALFNLALGLPFLLNPAKAAQGFFLTADNAQGLATLRADFPAFFIAAAVFIFYGVFRRDGRAFVFPMLLFAIALFGRFVSIVVDGSSTTTAPPMIAEAVMVGVLALGWRQMSGQSDKGTTGVQE